MTNRIAAMCSPPPLFQCSVHLGSHHREKRILGHEEREPHVDLELTNPAPVHKRLCDPRVQVPFWKIAEVRSRGCLVRQNYGREENQIFNAVGVRLTLLYEILIHICNST